MADTTLSSPVWDVYVWRAAVKCTRCRVSASFMSRVSRTSTEGAKRKLFTGPGRRRYFFKYFYRPIKYNLRPLLPVAYFWISLKCLRDVNNSYFIMLYNGILKLYPVTTPSLSFVLVSPRYYVIHTFMLVRFLYQRFCFGSLLLYSHYKLKSK